MTFRSPYTRGGSIEPFDGAGRAAPGTMIGGVSSAFRHRFAEAQHALDGIQPYGVFDAEPEAGFTRTARKIDKPRLNLARRPDFPVITIEDRSAGERHIAILSERPQAKLLFSRHRLERLASRLVREDEEAGDHACEPANVIAFAQMRIVFYSYHLPMLPQFGGVVRRHTGQHTRTGFQLDASAIELANPFALVHAAIALEPDLAEILAIFPVFA